MGIMSKLAGPDTPIELADDGMRFVASGRMAPRLGGTEFVCHENTELVAVTIAMKSLRSRIQKRNWAQFA